MRIGTGKSWLPFGRGNKRDRRLCHRLFGNFRIMMQIRSSLFCVGQKIKRAIESKLVALAAWMKEVYGGTMIQGFERYFRSRSRRRSRRSELSGYYFLKREEKRLDTFLHKNQKARAKRWQDFDQPCQDYELLTKSFM